MKPKDELWKLITLCANQETTTDDRKIYYQNALALVRNKKPKIKRVTPDSFLEFWTLYPNKVAKQPAEQAYIKALNKTTHETILNGVRWYVGNKPDGVSYAHAATWLNACRWEDGQSSGMSNPTRREIWPDGTPEWKQKLSDVIGAQKVHTWFKDVYVQSGNYPDPMIMCIPKEAYNWVKSHYEIDLNKLFGKVEIRSK